jgi:hypothetical protein
VKKVRAFWGNALALILFLALGLGAVLFLRAQSHRPAGQQEPGTVTAPISPLDTPQATRVPTVIPVIITTIPTPTPAPSPTPTPTFEPLSDKPIGGYIFGSPEPFSPRGYIEIVEWLPGSNEEVIVRNFENDRYLVELLNVKSGQHQRLVETAHNIVDNPVWLPHTQQIAYLAQDETGALGLYFSASNNQGTNLLTQGNVSPPLVPAPDGKSVIVLDKQRRQLLKSNEEVKNIPKLTLAQPLPVTKGGPFARYQAAWSNKTNWVAYYNSEKFVLVNPPTGETQNVDLGMTSGLEQFWAIHAVWRPDGEELAVIVTSDSPVQTITFTRLAIFNPTTGEIQLIGDNFAYVTNVAWAPDNRHVLLVLSLGSVTDTMLKPYFW